MTLQPGSGKKGSKKAGASPAVKGQPQLTNFFGKPPSASTPQRDASSQLHAGGGGRGGNTSATPSPASSEPQGSIEMMETDIVSTNVKEMEKQDSSDLPAAQEGDEMKASSVGAVTTDAQASTPADTTTTTQTASRPSGRGKPVSKKRSRGKGKGDKENIGNDVQEAASASPVKEGDADEGGQPTTEDSGDGEEKGAEGTCAGGDQDSPGMECEDEAADPNASVAMEVEDPGDDDDVVEVVPPPQQDADTTEPSTTTTTSPDPTASEGLEGADPAAQKAKAKGKAKGGGAKGRGKKPAAPAGPPSALELKYQAQLDELLKRWRETEEAEEADHRMGVQELVDEMTSPSITTTGADSATPGGDPKESDDGADKLSELLGRLVQGSRLPLVALSQRVLLFMSEALLPCVEALTEEAIRDKIRVVAERKYYGVMPKEPPRWEDTSDLSMLVWETAEHFLPSDSAAVVKELRADRSFLGRHIKALHNLIQVIRQHPSDTAKITPLEEKVFKLDRDEDAARQKKLRRAKLKEEKEAAAAEKAEKARLREEEKQKKEVEKQKKKEEAQRKKEETEKRKREEAAEPGAEAVQKKARASTDGASAKKKPPPPPPGQSLFKFFKKQEPKDQEAGAEGGKPADTGGSGVPMEVEEKTREDGIDQAVHSGLGFHELMLRRREERKKDDDVLVIKKPHKFVKVKVAVSRAREGSMWDAPDYAELVEVELWNRMKMLQFHEDYRPAYYGTWTKRSKLVTGRRPFSKDKRLDYDYDSEEDWEEDDADQGESLSVTADDDDQDPDDGLDYEDGWLRRDDDFGLSDGEEGPDGALGIHDNDREGGMNRVGPFFFNSDFECSTPLPPQPEEAERVKATLEGYRVQVLDMALLQMEGLGEAEAQVTTTAASGAEGTATETPSSSTAKSRSKPVDPELRPALVQIVHLSTMGKDKLAEEFLNKNPGAASKAKVKATIDEIASKQRRIKGGSVWMVKDTILAEYGMATPVPEPEPEPDPEAEQPVSAEKSSKEKDKEDKKEKEAAAETPPKGMQKINTFFPKAQVSEAGKGDAASATKDAKGGIEDVVMVVVDNVTNNEPASEGAAGTDPASSDHQTPPPIAHTVQRRFRGSDEGGWEEAKVSS